MNLKILKMTIFYITKERGGHVARRFACRLPCSLFAALHIFCPLCGSGSAAAPARKQGLTLCIFQPQQVVGRDV